MRFFAHISTLLCLGILMTTSLHAAEIRLEAEVFIEIQAGGKICRIRKVDVPCEKAVAYLRETLKLPSGTAVGVKAGQTAPYKEVKKVLDDVHNSEFVHPVARVIDPKQDNGK
jgi:biopolymer transport protein ExbD